MLKEPIGLAQSICAFLTAPQSHLYKCGRILENVDLLSERPWLRYTRGSLKEKPTSKPTKKKKAKQESTKEADNRIDNGLWDESGPSQSRAPQLKFREQLQKKRKNRRLTIPMKYWSVEVIGMEIEFAGDTVLMERCRWKAGVEFLKRPRGERGRLSAVTKRRVPPMKASRAAVITRVITMRSSSPESP